MDAKWFAGRLRELRLAVPFTREQLAHVAGVKASAIRDIEQGLYSPNWETVVAIATALKVTPDAFLVEPAERPAPSPGRPKKTPSEPGEAPQAESHPHDEPGEGKKSGRKRKG